MTATLRPDEYTLAKAMNFTDEQALIIAGLAAFLWVLWVAWIILRGERDTRPADTSLNGHDLSQLDRWDRVGHRRECHGHGGPCDDCDDDDVPPEVLDRIRARTLRAIGEDEEA